MLFWFHRAFIYPEINLINIRNIGIDMRKFVLATVFTFMLLTSSALAFQLDVTPNSQRSGMNEVVTYTIIIENDQNFADEFFFDIHGPNLA